jgi:azurin
MFNWRNDMRVALVAAVVCLCAIPAAASQADAKSCAAGLDANSQLIFNTVLPSVTPSIDLRTAVTDATKSLVMSGKLPRAEARPAAMAAGECLKLAKQ